MNKHTLDQRGGAHLLILLVILMLAIFGFAGWRAWQINSSKSSSEDATKTSKIDTTDATEPPLERISSASDSYSVALPAGWISDTCEDNDILFLAPNTDLLGKCGSEYFGAVSISRTAGDRRSESDPRSDPSAVDVSVSSVTINRQPATKTSYTVGGEEIVIPVGTRFTRYQIFYEGDTYTIGTSHLPGGTSYVSELDALVRTFRFSE